MHYNKVELNQNSVITSLGALCSTNVNKCYSLTKLRRPHYLQSNREGESVVKIAKRILCHDIFRELIISTRTPIEAKAVGQTPVNEYDNGTEVTHHSSYFTCKT